MSEFRMKLEGDEYEALCKDLVDISLEVDENNCRIILRVLQLLLHGCWKADSVIELDMNKQYFNRMIGCHGCAHEASEPCKKGIHRNSGESACMLCIRAPKEETEKQMEKIIEARGWSRLEFPKDMYISAERFEHDVHSREKY